MYLGEAFIEMAARFVVVFAEKGRLWSATELFKKVLEARQRTLGSEHPDTLRAMTGLANSYSDVGRRQEAMENLPSKKLKKLDKLIGWFKRL